MEGGAVAAARIVRRDGRDADVDPRSRAATSRCSSMRSAPRRRRVGPAAAGVAARDAAALAAVGAARHARRGEQRSRADVRSYGYGLSVTQTCQFRAVVAHSGGLPGLRVAHALAAGLRRRHHRLRQRHLYRLGPGGRRGLRPDGRHRGLQPREVRPSEALTRAQRDVSRLIVGWDDTLADSLAAENLFLDRSKDRRRREIEALVSKAGACSPPTGFDVVENALRGQWTMAASAARCVSRLRSRRQCPPPPVPGAVTTGAGAASDLLVGIQIPRDGIEWQTLGHLSWTKVCQLRVFVNSLAPRKWYSGKELTSGLDRRGRPAQAGEPVKSLGYGP